MYRLRIISANAARSAIPNNIPNCAPISASTATTRFQTNSQSAAPACGICPARRCTALSAFQRRSTSTRCMITPGQARFCQSSSTRSS